ncbi:MAG: nucleoside kinase [Treponema sp.]|jgi:uridine kinase|nr:nucleoside kinase [Treponema sp.]
MKSIILRFPNGKELDSEAGKTPADFLAGFDQEKDAIFAVKFNNELTPLGKRLMVSGSLEPVLKETREGSAVYRESLRFVLSASCHALFPGAKLLIGHSLGYSYYYTLEKPEGTPLASEDIQKINSEMRRIVKADYPITQEVISYAEACALFESLGLTASREELRYICPPLINVNTMEGFSELYFGPLAASTGTLALFDIRPYDEGFLLRYPSTIRPDQVAPFEDIPKLFAVYKHHKQWGKRLGVTSAASLNRLINERTAKDFVDIAELLQQNHFADIARQIASRDKVKLVLIAGPSSSGKTTSSKKLSLQLRASGFQPKVIELDSYYVGRAHTPRDEKGDYDYECLEALDVAQLGKDLDVLFSGGEIKVPSYDFVEGARFYTGAVMRLGPEDILILEGIHGLNDRLTPGVSRDYKFKLYLSAITQLNLDDHNRIPTSDNRLIRRIVRDSQFRGKTASDTIKMWDNVQKGERLHIFPFQNNADAILNTALDYELAVLKVYADPLLKCVTPFEPEYAEASRLLHFLNNFLPISSQLVPGKSIIREFIGGSDFSY